MKAVFYEIQGWEKKILRKLKMKKLFLKDKIDKDNLAIAKDAEIVSVFVYSKIDKDVLKKLKKVKLIVTRSTGFDHIDLKECKKRKIVVCNIPAYGSETVAEHTFALILALSRKICKANQVCSSGNFTIRGLDGFDLSGKVLGVVGAGRIGKHVIRIARGFNMKVLATDHHPSEFLEEELNFEYVSFDELLKKSDIVSIHIPYTKKNHHLFNKKVFDKMKKGSFLINTSRGAIVDTKDLIKAIDEGRLGGAGLDVIEGEKFIKEEKQLIYEENNSSLKKVLEFHVLASKPNVILTPHIAFYTKEALNRIIEDSVEIIKKFEKGKLDYNLAI